MRVTVLGAGVIGTTSAYYLARHGHEVTVVERHGAVAKETSFANGGMLHGSLVDPWNAPGIAFKLLKWLGREDAPALLRPRAVPGMLRWGTAFLAHSSPARHRRHTLINLRLALYSGRMLEALRDETGIRYDERQAGLLKLFRDRAALEHGTAFAARLKPYGVPFRALDAKATVELEPALAPVADQIAGAIHFPDDESGDACKFTEAVAALARREGVEFIFDTTIDRLQANGARITGVLAGGRRLEADAYVLALGSYSPRAVRGLDLALPVNPVKGYSLTAPLGAWNAAPRLPVVDETLKVGVVVLGDRVRVAGSAEFAGYDTTISARRADYLWSTATRVYPALARHVERDQAQPWVGLRPMTPDGPPILGPTRYANLFLNTGHGHLGWTMACGSASALADLVSGRTPEIDLDGLTVERFA